MMTNTLDPSTNPMTCDLWIKGGVINFGKNVDTISLWTKVERMIDFNRHQFFGLGESFGIFHTGSGGLSVTIPFGNTGIGMTGPDYRRDSWLYYTLPPATSPAVHYC